MGDLCFAVGIEDLNFVTVLEVDPGVGAFWDHEFSLDRAVSELIDGLEVAGFFGVGGVGEEEGFGSGFSNDLIGSGISGGCFFPTVGRFEDFLPFEG